MTQPRPGGAGDAEGAAVIEGIATARQQDPLSGTPTSRRQARARELAGRALKMPPIPRHFRADIEGMRAISVLGVMLWHAGLPIFPGGFTGVDVFFVVSGFLMTSLLLEESRTTGRVRLGRFYARRGRRLLPAALTALVGTALLTVLVLPRTRWYDVGGDILASATYLINWRLANRSVDYMDLERAPSPVQHYWSLAVEEQFYLLWPILILLLLFLARGRARHFRYLTWTLTSVLFVSSLALSWWWTAQDASAYFVTPTRLFELMLGAAVALGGRRWPGMPRWLAAVLGWVGIGLVIASLFVITAESAFPGTLALLPTVGAALVLVGGSAAGGWGPEIVLRARPLQWLGLLSYSLYLWHWPFVAVAAEIAQVGRGGPETLPVHWGVLAVAISIVPAWLSFHYIENPIRRRGAKLQQRVSVGLVTQSSLHLSLRCSLAGAGVGLLLMTLAPTTVTGNPVAWRTPAAVDALRPVIGASTLDPEGELAGEGNGGAGEGEGADPSSDDPARTSIAEPPHTSSPTTAAPEPTMDPIPDEIGELAVPLEQVADDVPLMVPEGCNIGLTGVDVGVCEAGDPEGEITVALMGDSHSGMWLPALDDIGQARGWRVITLQKSSCPPTPGVMVRTNGQEYTQCAEYQENLSAMLPGMAPDVVLLSSSAYVNDAQELAEGMARRVEEIEAAGGKSILLRDVPRPPFNVPECLLENPERASRCAFDRQDGLDRSGTGQAELQRLLPDLPVLDFTEAICPGPVCGPVLGGVVVWRDNNHLSSTYVRSMRELVESELAPLVDDAEGSVQSEGSG